MTIEIAEHFNIAAQIILNLTPQDNLLSHGFEIFLPLKATGATTPDRPYRIFC